MPSTFALSSSAVSETTQIETLAKPLCQQNKKPPRKWLDEPELKEEVLHQHIPKSTKIPK